MRLPVKERIAGSNPARAAINHAPREGSQPDLLNPASRFESSVGFHIRRRRLVAGRQTLNLETGVQSSSAVPWPVRLVAGRLFFTQGTKGSIPSRATNFRLRSFSQMSTGLLNRGTWCDSKRGYQNSACVIGSAFCDSIAVSHTVKLVRGRSP